MVNLLTVAYNRKGNPGLVLDRRQFNPCLHSFPFKYEIAGYIFASGDFVCLFDLQIYGLPPN